MCPPDVPDTVSSPGELDATDADALDEFALELTESGLHPDMLRLDASGSILVERSPSSNEKQTLRPFSDSEITLKRPLARGGMGEVFIGEQVSLRREVAVKALRADGRADDDALIEEARIAGYVEHPNVIPIHALGTETGGRTLLVMKRVDGQSWRTMLADGPEIKRDAAILMEVCKALHYAHARGVVHRDLKPHNVMVGAFGEVYVLDWGLAAGFGDNAPTQLLQPLTPHNIVGTPSYLAPEMSYPGAPPSPRSDVYLAGAVLFHILTGRPPHRGASIIETLLIARNAEAPRFTADVPEELADICARAMAPSPEDRFGSMDALRLALASFVEHAAARELCADAEERLSVLQRPNAHPLNASLQTLFAECRFGFKHALSIWPTSKRARTGLRAALVAMIEREIDAGHGNVASALADELGDDVPTRIAVALEGFRAQRDKAAQAQARLAAIAHEHDIRTSVSEREKLIMAGVSIWFVISIVFTVLDGTGQYSAGPGTFAIGLGLVTLAFIAAYGFVPSLRATRATRAAVFTMISTAAALALTHGLSWFLGLRAHEALILGQVTLATGLMSIAIQHSRSWFSAAIALVVCWPMYLFQGHAVWISGAGAFFGVLIFVFTWRPEEEDGAQPAPKAESPPGR